MEKTKIEIRARVSTTCTHSIERHLPAIKAIVRVNKSTGMSVAQLIATREMPLAP